MADMEASIKLTADMTAVETQLAGIIAQFEALTGKSLPAAAGGLVEVEGGAKAASAGLAAAAESSSVLDKFLEDVGLHSRTVAIGLESMGLSAEASAAKIGGLVEAFASLKSAVPALLLITAGFAAVFGSFELIKDSISDAGKWNQSMQVLGATVTAQGGDWKTLSKDVAEYADLQERTTTFSRDQVVDALKQLTSAGMGVAEAMQVNRIAEDASIATGQSLVTVNHALVEAMHGRTQALTMLGIGTKASIKAGMSFSDILTAIEKQMGGTAAAALNTLPGALSELGNVFESFKESVGQNLQQPLIALVQTFISLVENDGPPVVDFINNLTNTAELLGHEVTSEIIPAFNDLVAAFQPTIDGVHNLTEEVVGSHNGWQILQQLIENAAQAIRDFTEFLANNKDLVEVFFDVLIAVKAVGALTALQGSFALTVVGGGAFTTVIETLASVFTVGFIPTLQAVTASVWEFVASETAATMGLNLLIGGAIVAFIEGMQHMDSVVHTVDDTIAGLLGDIHNIYDALEELFNSISGWIPGANLLADAFGAIGTAAGNAANAIRDMNNAKAAQAGNLDSPNAIMSQQMAGLELTIATDKNPKDVAEAKKNLSALFIKRGDNADGTYGSESGNPATIPDDHTMVGGGHGKKKKSGSGSGYNATKTNVAAEDLNNIRKEKKALADAVDADTLAEAENKIKIDDSLTSVGAKTAAEEKLYSAYQNSIKSLPQLTSEVTTEKTTADAARISLEAKYDAYTDSVDALNGLKESLSGKTKLSKDDKEAIHDATAAEVAAQLAYKKSDKDLISVNATLAERKKQLDAATKATKNFVNEQQNLMVSFNDKEAAAQQKQTDTEATYGLSPEAQLAYYQQLLTAKKQEDQDYFDVHHFWNQKIHDDDAALYDKVLQLQTTEYTKAIDAARKRYSEEEKYVGTFLSDLLVKHKSFSSELKSIYDDILKAFITMVEKMIVESKLFQGIMGALGIATGSSAAGGILSLAGASSSGGAHGPNGSSSSPISVVVQDAGSNFLSKTTGSTSGVSPFSAPTPAMTGLMVLAGAAGVGGLIGSMEGAGTGAQKTHATNGMIGGVAGAAAGGLGALALGFGGGAFGTLGAGLSMFTPAGWAILAGGALLGGLAGGAIGPHWGPATNYPDRADTQNYGGFVSDVNGVSGNFNGTSISPQSKFSGENTAKDMAHQMYAWAQANASDAIAKQILALGASGSDIRISNEKDGVFTLSDGTKISVTDYEKLGSAFNSKIASGGASTSPIFALDRLAPDFNTARTSAWTSNSRTTGVPTPSGAGGIDPIHHHPPILVTINNPRIYGAGGVEEFALQIETAIARNRTHNSGNRNEY